MKVTDLDDTVDSVRKRVRREASHHFHRKRRHPVFQRSQSNGYAVPRGRLSRKTIRCHEDLHFLDWN
jgi:hypothetical protein